MVFPVPLPQDLLKNVSQQEERLKKMEDIKEVQEANRLLKADRDRLEQELQQVTAKVRVSIASNSYSRSTIR